MGRLPPAALALPLARRLALLWAAGRGLLWLAGLELTSVAPHLLFPPLVAGLLVAELRRRDEHLLLVNLGVSLPTVAALALAVAAALDAGAHVAAAALAP